MVARKKAQPKRARTSQIKVARLQQPKVAAEQPIMAALRAEHRYITSIMEAFARQIDAVDSGDLADTHIIYETMDYMVRWSDGYHHPREDLVYSRAAEINASAADNVDSLQREHDQMSRSARKLLADIDRWRMGQISGDSVVTGGRAYIKEMYAHMKTEDELVFPQIESLLDIADWRDLAADDQLRPVQDPVFGLRVDREFRNLARKLRRGVRHSVERGAMVEWIGIEALLESLEVISIAYDSTRNRTGDHLRTIWGDTKSIMRESPMSGLFRCAANNMRLTASFVGDVVGISKDTLDDLSRVNQERRNRVRLLDQTSR